MSMDEAGELGRELVQAGFCIDGCLSGFGPNGIYTDGDILVIGSISITEFDRCFGFGLVGRDG
jgi:hypothetical protein